MIVTELNAYPLTGARAESMEFALMSPGGIVTDRLFVLYDSSKGTDEENRVSMKRFPKLAQVYVDPITEIDQAEIHIPGCSTLTVGVSQDEQDCFVNEFGDSTPCVDMGDEAGEAFAHFLGFDEVRLAQKTIAWHLGEHGDDIAKRRVAPLHIVTEESLGELRKRAAPMNMFMGFDNRRFRPNIILQTGDRAFAENEWVGQNIKIGATVLEVTEETVRCPVPGYDPTTGKSMKDIPKLYRGLKKSDKNQKPVYGVYARPLVEPGNVDRIQVGDNARIVP